MSWAPTPIPFLQMLTGWSGSGPVIHPQEPQPGWYSILQGIAIEAGLGFDEAGLFAHLVAVELAAGRDAAGLAAHLLGSDSGLGSDRSGALVHLAGSDLATGLDVASWMLHYDALAVDLGVGYDPATLAAHLLGTDASSCVDQGALAAHLLGGDIAIGGDSARPTYMIPWSGSKAATVLDHATWTDLFTFTATGSGTASATFTVSHSWGSNFLHWANEQRGIRVLVNGSQVATQMQSYTTGSWSSTMTQPGVTVPGEAHVQIQGYGETTTYPGCRTVTVSSASMTIQGVS